MLNDLSRQLRRLLKEATRSNAGQRPKHNVIRLRSTATQAGQPRLLTNLGSRMHATSVARGDACSIAILDASGTVVAWYDSLPGATKRDFGIVGRHVSQFYLAHDVVLQRPDRRLIAAGLHGSDTQQRWCRRPGGSIFWGVTVIAAMRLDSGALQGYSHVTRHFQEPRELDLAHIRRAPRQSLPCYGGVAAVA